MKLENEINKLSAEKIENYMEYERDKTVDGFAVLEAIENDIFESGVESEFYYTDDDLKIIIEGFYDHQNGQIIIESIRNC